MLTKRLTKLFSQETARVKSISFHPQKPIFITGLHNGAIRAWDYQSKGCMYEFLDHEGSVRAVAFHPQGDFFISAGDDKVIRLWDYTHRTLSKKFKGHTDFVRALDFHPTKPWFASSSDDQTIRVWNFMTGKCLGVTTGHSHYVMAVRFINESTIISGSLDQSLRVWNCEGLLDTTKKSSFVPNIIVKQIINGHERGINSIFVSGSTIVSGGDDREVKLWEYNGYELVERESFFNHHGCITSVSYNEQTLVSVGEEGLMVVYNNKRTEKANIEGRFWVVSQKKNMIIAGHDSGFEVFKYDEPKLVCKSENGYFYTKDFNIFYSNLKTEKKVCDPSGLLLSMHSLDNLLLIQFSNHFEVYRKNKCILKEHAEAVFVKEGVDVCLVVREKNSYYLKSLEGSTKKVLDLPIGSLLHGGEDYFFIRKGLSLHRFTIKGEERIVSLGFKVENVVLGEGLYAFMSKNELQLYDLDLNLINTAKEIVTIHGGFFHDGAFIYSTSKHLKYLFGEEGVIRSIDLEVVPFYFSEDQVFYLTNEGFESIDVDLTEVEFKKLVIEGKDVTPLIESKKLPGLSPLSFLIKKQKGEVALPYIQDPRQRFELSLGDGKLQDSLELCRQEGDHNMYKALADVALRECNFEIAEECLWYLEEWKDLFMLYVCSGREEKLKSLFEVADDQIKKMVKFYQEDVKYFYGDLECLDGDDSDKSIQDNTLYDDLNHEPQADFPHLDSQMPPQEASGFLHLVDKEEFDKIDVADDFDSEEKVGLALESVTKGDFKGAIAHFYDLLYRSSLPSDEENRRFYGMYLSGLNIELKRPSIEDPLKSLLMAQYFAGLPLKKEHHLLAKAGYVYACIKKGNLKTAKALAEEIKKEGTNIPKVVLKALKIQNGEDKFVLTTGTFCFDTLDVSETFKTCRLCYTKSKEGRLCGCCRVGLLE